MRGDLVESKKYPEVLDYLKDKIEKAYNITFDTNQGRLDWITQQPDAKVEDFLKRNCRCCIFCRLRFVVFTPFLSHTAFDNTNL